MSDLSSSEVAGGRSVFVEALRTSVSFITVWFALGVALALVPLAVAMGWFGVLSDAIGRAYEPGSLVMNLDVSFRADQSARLGALEQSSGSALAILGLVYVLAGVFRAGGWLQVFLERRQGRSLRRFFFGGGRYFFRFVRVGVLVLLGLAVVSWALEDLPWKRLVDERLLGLGAGGELEDLDSEMTVVWRTWAKAGVAFLATGLILTWALYTRTRMALHDTSSAVTAGALSAWLLVRHPIRTLRPVAMIFVIEALFLAGLAWAVQTIEGGLGPESTWIAVSGLYALSITALFGREILRGARYSASVQVSAELLRQPMRPDPWHQSLGGPGGPRYPIDTDEADEFGVSL